MIEWGRVYEVQGRLWCATGAKGDLFSIEWNFMCQRPKAGSFSFFFVCVHVWLYSSVGGRF